MEEWKEEGEEEIQEHGPERWLPKWERQCQAQVEQDQQLSPELQEAAAAAKPEHKLHQLWHLFQDPATAVAQLYKDPVCQQPALSLCSLSKRNCRRHQPLPKKRGDPSAKF
ncbi:Hypothetical predicted protein [Marmota monax]|uniref:Uncharacterized protein n=1 Tax=Marmota monax TaxID=9995 RepID=A0A5E4BDB7_MARMO|nr:Hypothetical predicted protein [Marmota monax]